MASTSSWSWRNLLSPGSASTASAQAAGSGNGGRDDGTTWAETPDHPLDLPNMLGMENFGNTCYVNSVLQALWFCDPFRESILAYLALREQTTVGSSVASSSKTPMADAKQAQQQETVTLFSALQTLFQRMATAKDFSAAPVPIPAKAPEATGSQSTSSFGASLSRKVSSRPGTAVSRGNAASTVSPPPSAGLSGPGGLAPTLQSSATGNLSSCSNVLVPNTDIKAFLSALRKSNILFDSTAHQDAHELLNHVLNAIGDDLVTESRKGIHDPNVPSSSLLDVTPDGKSFVHRIFEGVLTNETRCMTCESVTSRDECFLDLSLDIERNMSVSGCLQQFSASEMLCSRNKFFCDTCSALQEAEKRMKIKKQPVVLALHLKRFKYEESMGRFVKLAYRVVFPMQLRLSNISDDADEPDKLYKLYGIVVHIGQGPHHGHYIAILRISTRWFLFDDETIRIIDEEDIVRYYGDAAGPGSAYVLFYQAEDMDFAGLGIPNLPQMRAENARRRKQEMATAMRLESQNALLRRRSSRDDVLNGNTDSAGPSRTGTPAEGKSSLFSRRGFNLNPPSMSGSTAGVAAQGDTIASPTDSGKSWLSSFKPRKASISTNQPALSIPVPAFGEVKNESSASGARARSPSRYSSPGKDVLASPSSPIHRQRSPTHSQHSEQSQTHNMPSSPQGMLETSLSAAEHTASGSSNDANQLHASTKPSTGQRVLSGLGIGSPPKRTQTLPLSSDASSSSLTASSQMLVDLRNDASGADMTRGRSELPSMATEAPGSDKRAAPTNRLRSPSASTDLRGNNGAPSGTNANGTLSRRRTTLSRAFGLMRGGKDKDKDKDKDKGRT